MSSPYWRRRCAGFQVEALYGDFSGGAFEDTSPEMVWLAQRCR